MLNYNFFILIEALLNKIIKLSKWGRDYDLKNEIFYDNLFIIYHQIVSCISDYAREAETDGVITIYARLKSYIFGLKKIMFYELLHNCEYIASFFLKNGQYTSYHYNKVVNIVYLYYSSAMYLNIHLHLYYIDLIINHLYIDYLFGKVYFHYKKIHHLL
jgi:hypothetical protein